MIMKIINNNYLNACLERALNSRFSGSKRVALLIALFLVLSSFALEKIIRTLFLSHHKLK